MAETREEPNIEIDTAAGGAGDDGDSAIGEETISQFTTSITSSVLDYPVENGRRYHAFRSGVYPLPNDELEQDRLDLSHALVVKSLDDKLFTAPIDTDKMKRVLDIGTGTGIWAMSMGDEYPHANIIGNDLSATQPPWVPPNLKFEVDDVESPWVYDAPFDFIFCRYMAGCIMDWPALVKNIHNNLAPGGWAEFQDFDLMYYSEDGSLTEDHHTYKWIKPLLDASRKVGRDPCPGLSLEKWVKDAGFKNVVHKRVRLPIGTWPKDPKMKELGMYNLANVFGGLEGFSLRLFCHVLGWQQEEVLLLTSEVRKELKTRSLHCQYDMHVVYGQKAED